MGVVWKAVDSVLGRTVAIKVLPPTAADHEARRRLFLQEARLASSVSHAHIAQVHDLGREGNLDFIVMEYVEGKPLSRILQGRPLPPDKVVGLGLQVARGLARAHRKGLLHRDLKPGNVMVTADGDVKVVDFGLATLFEHQDSSLLSEISTRENDDQESTAEGRAVAEKGRPLVGTLPYMSPEQVRAETLDARSDIFSLGVVLYEMTTGQRPFAGATSADLARDIARARPRPPHQLAPKLPLELDRIIQKTLAPERTDRYQTMEDLAIDLKRLERDLESGSSPSYEDLKGAPSSGGTRRLWAWALAGTLAAGLVAGAAWWIVRPRRPTADERTILIAPMDVRGQDEGSADLGRAFAEAIAINLARAKSLKVLPVQERSSHDEKGGLSRVVAALDAGAGRLLTGTLAREKETIQASLSLVDTAQGRIVWGVQKRSSDLELPILAESIARDVQGELGAVAPKLYEHFLYLTGTPAMSASPDFGAALGALQRHEDANAMEATKRLVDDFPTETDAWVLRLVAISFHRNTTPTQKDVRAFAEARAALERLDPLNPWGEKFAADWLKDSEGRKSLPTYARLLARDDLSPAARANVLLSQGLAQSYLGHTDLALSIFQEALRLNPADDTVNAALSGVLERLGRGEEALAKARLAVALNPGSFQNNWVLGSMLQRLKRWEDAISPWAKACDINQDQWACAYKAVALKQAGHEQEAVNAALEADALPEDESGAYARACYAAVTGDTRGALRLLWRALDLGLTDTDDLYSMAYEPALSSLRGQKEFDAIVAEARKRHLR